MGSGQADLRTTGEKTKQTDNGDCLFKMQVTGEDRKGDTEGQILLGV